MLAIFLLHCVHVQLSEELSSGHNETSSRQQLSKVEDILIKTIRLVANVSINADIGEQLACTERLLELLMNVIGRLRDWFVHAHF